MVVVMPMMYAQVHHRAAQEEQIREVGQKSERMLLVVFKYIEQVSGQHRADEHRRKAVSFAVHGNLPVHWG